MPRPSRTCAFGVSSETPLLFIISLLLKNFLTALDLIKSKIYHLRNVKTLNSPSDCLHDWANWARQIMPAKNAGRKGGIKGPYFLFFQACSCNSIHQRQEPVEINIHHSVMWSRDWKGTARSLRSLKICSSHFRPKRSRLSSRHLLIKWLL